MKARPTVILIGGAPGAGKSTLGRALAARLEYGSLTGDDLLVAARTLTTSESHPEFHWGGGRGHVYYFTETPKEELVSDAVARERGMWPVVQKVISSHLETGAPVVIDWWLLRPKAVIDVDYDDRVRSLWLHIDQGALWDRERSNTGWMKGSSDPARMLDNFMHRSLWRNALVAEEADELDLPLLHLAGAEPFDVLVDHVLGLLDF